MDRLPRVVRLFKRQTKTAIITQVIMDFYKLVETTMMDNFEILEQYAEDCHRMTSDTHQLQLFYDVTDQTFEFYLREKGEHVKGLCNEYWWVHLRNLPSRYDDVVLDEQITFKDFFAYLLCEIEASMIEKVKLFFDGQAVPIFP